MQQCDPHTLFGADTETIDGYCRLLAVETCGVGPIDSARQMHDALCELAGVQIVFYNLDYDVGAIAKYMNRANRAALYLAIPVTWGKLRVRYLRNKQLSIICGGRVTYAYDCFQFYNMSLEKAAAKYLDEHKHDVDASQLTETDLRRPEVIDYCYQDAALAGKLMRKFLFELPRGVERVPPLSSAYVSARYFRREMYATKLPLYVQRDFKRTFHGGRFEIFARGTFRNVYYYDIHSAYPTAIRDLRGLAGAHIHNQIEGKFQADYGAYLVTVEIPQLFAGPLMLRTPAGLSICPVGKFKSWVTKSELDTLRRAGYLVTLHAGTSVIGQNTRPFGRKINYLYRERQRRGVYGYKVILNGLYGKFCQSITRYERPKTPRLDRHVVNAHRYGTDYYFRTLDDRLANFIWAAAITADVRLKLWELIHQYERHVLAVFTDCIITDIPLPLELGDGLGQWEAKKLDEIILIGSGVYFWRTGADVGGHLRGFNITGQSAEKLLDVILSARRSVVQFDTKRRYSFVSVHRAGDYSRENLIMSVVKNLDLNFDRKRIWDSEIRSGADLSRQIYSLAHPFVTE